jgi:hypothetical protein
MLALCLEKLDQAVDAPDDVRIYLDTSTEERLSEVEWVRDTYLPRAQIFHAKSHTPAPSGTWNILNAIRQGYETGASGVFLIEEDVLIRPKTFFSWHREQMATGKYLATCGRTEIRLFALHNYDYYTNPGSLLSRQLIERILPHLCDAYYSDLRGYLLAHFPRWDVMSILDDGLIRRVIEQMGGRVLTAVPGVCVHQGFHFYNNIDIYKNHETAIDKKIARLREIIASLKPGGRYCKDFEPF